MDIEREKQMCAGKATLLIFLTDLIRNVFIIRKTLKQNLKIESVNNSEFCHTK